jgi:hypothetical protein
MFILNLKLSGLQDKTKNDWEICNSVTKKNQIDFFIVSKIDFYLFEVLRSSSSFTKKSSGQMSVFHWSPSSLVAASVNTDFFQEEKSWSKGRRFETINPSLLTPIQRWTKRSIQNSYQQQEYWKFKALKNLEKLYFLNYYS